MDSRLAIIDRVEWSLFTPIRERAEFNNAPLLVRSNVPLGAIVANAPIERTVGEVQLAHQL
jgi:hypothetical protein